MNNPNVNTTITHIIDHIRVDDLPQQEVKILLRKPGTPAKDVIGTGKLVQRQQKPKRFVPYLPSFKLQFRGAGDTDNPIHELTAEATKVQFTPDYFIFSITTLIGGVAYSGFIYAADREPFRPISTFQRQKVAFLSGPYVYDFMEVEKR